MEVGHGDEALVGPGGQQGGLVEQVLQVCPGEARGGLGQVGQGGVLRQRLFRAWTFRDLLPAPDVRQPHIDLPVKAAGTQQGGVQNVLAVGGAAMTMTPVGGEAVHLHQQLVQRLLPASSSAAAQTGPSLAAHGVDLIDEYDGGASFLA